MKNIDRRRSRNPFPSHLSLEIRSSPSLSLFRLYRKPSRTKLETVEYLKSMQHAKLDDLDNEGGAAALSVHRGSSDSSRR